MLVVVRSMVMADSVRSRRTAGTSGKTHGRFVCNSAARGLDASPEERRGRDGHAWCVKYSGGAGISESHGAVPKEHEP